MPRAWGNKMMLCVLPSRKGQVVYVILETGNETRRSHPPLTEWYSCDTVHTD